MTQPNYPPPNYSSQPAYPLDYSTPGGPGGSPPLSPEGNVMIDIPCRKCGYNLRGLTMQGRCPECGMPVGISIQGDLLRFSNPRWLETLRRGVNLILAGIAIMVLLIIISILLQIARVNAGQVQALGGFLGLGSAALLIAGGWLLTTPDPSGIGEDRYGTSRKIIRIALIVGLASNLLNLSQTVIHDPTLLLALAVLGGLAGLVGLVGQFAQLQYLSKLAQRIPDPPLSDRARFLMWAIGISYGVLLLIGIVVAIFATNAFSRGSAATAGPPGAVIGVGCIAGILGLALLVFGIMYLVMLIKFGGRFKEAAMYAQQTWGSQAA
jgi:hypothetical protein